MTSTAYLVGFCGRRKLIAVCGKFAGVSREIWQTGPWNLEKFAAELWSLVIGSGDAMLVYQH